MHVYSIGGNMLLFQIQPFAGDTIKSINTVASTPKQAIYNTTLFGVNIELGKAASSFGLSPEKYLENDKINISALMNDLMDASKGRSLSFKLNGEQLQINTSSGENIVTVNGSGKQICKEMASAKINQGSSVGGYSAQRELVVNAENKCVHGTEIPNKFDEVFNTTLSKGGSFNIDSIGRVQISNSDGKQVAELIGADGYDVSCAINKMK